MPTNSTYCIPSAPQMVQMAKRIIGHGYVMWAVQQRQSTFYYQCMRLHTKEHSMQLCSLEYATLYIEKYYNGIVS